MLLVLEAGCYCSRFVRTADGAVGDQARPSALCITVHTGFCFLLSKMLIPCVCHMLVQNASHANTEESIVKAVRDAENTATVDFLFNPFNEYN